MGKKTAALYEKIKKYWEIKRQIIPEPIKKTWETFGLISAVLVVLFLVALGFLYREISVNITDPLFAYLKRITDLIFIGEPNPA